MSTALQVVEEHLARIAEREPDIHAFNLGSFAEIRFEKVRLAPIQVVGQDDVVLTCVEEPPRGVQADEAHSAYEKSWSGHQRSRVLGAKISSIRITRGVKPCSCEYSATVSSTF